MNTSNKLVRLVVAALMAAVCCVATMIIKIPVPATGGYLNLGDAVVLVSALMLGPVYGALAAGIGSTLADILAGYAQYAPATFVIKALMALVACLVFSATAKISLKKKWLSPIFTILAGICAEIILVAGYFVYEAFILSYGLGALASVVPNIMQGVAGIVGGTILCELLARTKIKSNLH